MRGADSTVVLWPMLDESSKFSVAAFRSSARESSISSGSELSSPATGSVCRRRSSLRLLQASVRAMDA